MAATYRSTVPAMRTNSRAKSVKYVRKKANQIHVDYFHCNKNLIRKRCTDTHHVHILAHVPSHVHAPEQETIVRNFVVATMIVRTVFLVARVRLSAIQIVAHVSLRYVNVIRIYVQIAALIKSSKQMWHVKMCAFNVNNANIC